MRIMVQLANRAGRNGDSIADEAELYVRSAALLIRTASASDTRLSYQFRANVPQLICRHLLLSRLPGWRVAPVHQAATLHRSAANGLHLNDEDLSADCRPAKLGLNPERLRARSHSQAPARCPASRRPLSAT